MPTLASHRKSRTRSGVGTNSPAVGVTTAAIASVTLLSTQGAAAAPAEPNPSVEEVQKKVDDLYRQAGSATQQYNKAKTATAKQKSTVDRVRDNVAKSADKLNEARRTLGSYAATQYREGTVAPTAALIFADSPQSFLEQKEVTDRLAERRQGAVADFQSQQADLARQRERATESLESLADSQTSLRTSKETVQKKLAEARTLLTRLTSEERARLAALERKKEDEARREAEAKSKAAAHAAARAAERERQERQERRERQEQPSAAGPESPAATGAGTTGTGTTGTDAGAGTAGATGGAAGGAAGGTPSSAGSAYATKAAKVLAFARAQIGKPYVWGASGPSSYDCSGLTQAAWKVAGVELPRTTWDQANTGTRVATDGLLPGDLVFFYDDVSHVGIYIGDGMMIHAPKPGANVREESIYYMPIHGSVRPA
ncbi:NlpC/P60 family protein [Streptomyces sp. NPDC091212]|uniref:C40 family peptidase n=1 Tax=Streptomyces sp. NPDC091212 TaxID=3155191 RepID=UPI003448E3C2